MNNSLEYPDKNCGGKGGDHQTPLPRDRGPTTRRGDGRDRGNRRAPSRPNHRPRPAWHIDTERDGLMFQDETGVVQLPRPNLPGDHQIENAGTAVAALRHLGFNDEVCEAAVSQAHWPARMQKLNTGPIIDSAPRAEIWLDGGHNPAAGQAIGHHLGTLSKRPPI